ncbi:hypothetical protein LJC21_04075, partial [Bacteroides sp. OttesenSCG-928-E20]|nr:hypothetical protein [Bacteroides sp. OttesenSCG-928-E20]
QLLFKCGLVGIVTGLIITLSLPNEYKSSILSSAESTAAEIAAESDFSAITATAMPSSIQMLDAVRPTRYPFVLSSVPFLTSLFNIPITLSTTNQTTTLYQYMTEHQRYPWWNLPKLFRNKEITNNDTIIDIFHLTEPQAEVVDELKERISVDVDKTRRTITLVVRMQDPLVAATVADSVSARLQDYVRKYRIQKENYNITYLEEVHNQAEKAYHQAQKVYAHFADRNHDLATQSAKKELTNLRIEKDIAYTHFVKTRRQLQAAKNRVVMERPVYAVIEPATVPVKPVGRWWMVVGCVVVAVVIGGGVGWMFYYKRDAIT